MGRMAGAGLGCLLAGMLAASAAATPPPITGGGSRQPAVSAAGIAEAGLVPHRATYRMSLGAATPGSGVIGARGAMEYRFTERCDGWTVENRTYLLIDYEGEGEVETAWNFASWESKDGLNFRFRVRHARDGKVVDAFRGGAELAGRGGSGVARFSSPANTTVDLPRGTLFPTGHLALLLDAARSGGGHLVRTVFDGTGLENPYQISAFIKAVETGGPPLADADLSPSRTWRMNLAFYPAALADPAPEFEIRVLYRADGIADGIRQVFSGFSVDLGLNHIEILPPPEC